MRELWGAAKLEAELAAAKDDLRCVEKNIRKILGRDAPDGDNGVVQPNNRVPQKRPLQEDRRRPGQDFQKNGFAPKRRFQPGIGNNNNAEPKTVFSRLSARTAAADDSADEDEPGFKPAVSSRVIATPRELPTRQDVMRRESTDERSMQRNRRMFGALMGTLQKFRQEETKLKAKEDKKAEIEARVEEAKRKEKEELKKERQRLFQDRKQQLAQVKALEAKLARSKQYQDWRASQIPLLNFIKTKAEPHIYYLPKQSTPETDTLLQESSKELKAEIDRREKILLEDIEILQSQSDGKNQSDKNISVSSNPNNSIAEDEAEEENRDMIPETNGDFDMIEVGETTNPNMDVETSDKSKSQNLDDNTNKNDEIKSYSVKVPNTDEESSRLFESNDDKQKNNEDSKSEIENIKLEKIEDDKSQNDKAKLENENSNSDNEDAKSENEENKENFTTEERDTNE